MSWNAWSKYEEKIISENYRVVPVLDYIHLLNNRTVCAVREKARRMGINKTNTINSTKDLFRIKFLLDRGYRVKSVVEKTDTNEHTVRNYIKRGMNGIKYSGGKYVYFYKGIIESIGSFNEIAEELSLRYDLVRRYRTVEYNHKTSKHRVFAIDELESRGNEVQEMLQYWLLEY